MEIGILSAFYSLTHANQRNRAHFHIEHKYLRSRWHIVHYHTSAIGMKPTIMNPQIRLMLLLTTANNSTTIESRANLTLGCRNQETSAINSVFINANLQAVFKLCTKSGDAKLYPSHIKCLSRTK